MQVIVIGRGNLAKHLIEGLKPILNKSLTQLIRTSNNNVDVGCSTNWEQLPSTALYLLAISDDAIEQVAHELPSDATVLHCSGSKPMSLLPQANAGVLYPLQTFTKDQKMKWSEVPIFIEAKSEKAKQSSIEISKILGGKTYFLNSKKRLQMHMAAVWSNNFTNHLLGIAYEICRKNQLPWEALHPIILETAQRASMHPPHSIQTGPASRGDAGIIQQHLEEIHDDQLKEIYDLLSHNIIQTQHNKNK